MEDSQPQEVEIVFTTTGECDPLWTVWLLNPEDPTDRITDLFESELEMDAISWARSHGYDIAPAIIRNITALIETWDKLDKRVDEILWTNDRAVILALFDRLTKGMLNMESVSRALEDEMLLVNLKKTSETR